MDPASLHVLLLLYLLKPHSPLLGFLLHRHMHAVVKQVWGLGQEPLLVNSGVEQNASSRRRKKENFPGIPRTPEPARQVMWLRPSSLVPHLWLHTINTARHLLHIRMAPASIHLETTEIHNYLSESQKTIEPMVEWCRASSKGGHEGTTRLSWRLAPLTSTFPVINYSPSHLLFCRLIEMITRPHPYRSLYLNFCLQLSGLCYYWDYLHSSFYFFFFCRTPQSRTVVFNEARPWMKKKGQKKKRKLKRSLKSVWGVEKLVL